MRSRALRVMVVDDSVVIRGLITRWIDAERDMEVVGSLRTGRDAVSQIGRVNPDVIILDIEMPDLDGISALPLLLAKKPDVVVIMASTLTVRNAEISFRALSLGAADYIPKPDNTRVAGAADVFRDELMRKVRTLGARYLRNAPIASLATPIPAPPLAPLLDLPTTPSASFETRRFNTTAPRVLVIGSSTGGPQALMSLVAGIGSVIDRVPVLITQHMPPTFTTILAEHLAKVSGRPVREGVHGEAVTAGRVYLAPGARHMRVIRSGAEVAIALSDDPPINFCRPAVDPLFASAVAIWHGATLGLMLTGMGSDGLRGSREIVTAGGNIIAQDEASSVVWGMPGAVAQAGLCAAVLPLTQIADRLHRLVSGVHA